MNGPIRFTLVTKILVNCTVHDLFGFPWRALIGWIKSRKYLINCTVHDLFSLIRTVRIGFRTALINLLKLQNYWYNCTVHHQFSPHVRPTSDIEKYQIWRKFATRLAFSSFQIILMWAVVLRKARQQVQFRVLWCHCGMCNKPMTVCAERYPLKVRSISSSTLMWNKIYAS